MTNLAEAHADGTGTLTMGGKTTTVTAANLDDCRHQLVQKVREEAARQQCPVLVTVRGPDEEHRLMVHPGGAVDPIAPNADISDAVADGGDAMPTEQRTPPRARFRPEAPTTPRGSSKVTGAATGVLDTIRDWSPMTKMGAAALVVMLLALIFGLALKSILSGGGSTPTATSTSSVSGDAQADGCLGGTDVIAGAKQAAGLATSSTIVQSGIRVPSPEGAAAAAATYARLRSTLPVPAGRDQALASIAATGASASVTQGIPATPGWTTHLDMSKARWNVVSGDGRTAGIDLLLNPVGAQQGKAATSSQLAVHMDLTVEGGQWHLKDVSAPKNPNALASAHSFAHTEACS